MFSGLIIYKPIRFKKTLLAASLMLPMSTAFALEIINIPEPKKPATRSSALSADVAASEERVGSVQPVSREMMQAWSQNPTASAADILSAAASDTALAAPAGHTSASTPKAAYAGPNIQHIGARNTYSKTKGFGKDVPFEQAMELILPTGWNLNVAPNVNTSATLVTWEQDANLIETIQRSVRNLSGNPYVTLDWNARVLSISNTGYEAARASTWRAVSGSTMKTTIEGWAQQTDWTVYWDLNENGRQKDFILGANANFSGEIDHAIEGLIRSISAARNTVEAELFSANRVIHVRKKTGPR